MATTQVLSALREIRNHVEAEIATYGAKVNAARAELLALDATIELFETKGDGPVIEFHTRTPRQAPPHSVVR